MGRCTASQHQAHQYFSMPYPSPSWWKAHAHIYLIDYYWICPPGWAVGSALFFNVLSVSGRKIKKDRVCTTTITYLGQSCENVYGEECPAADVSGTLQKNTEYMKRKELSSFTKQNPSNPLLTYERRRLECEDGLQAADTLLHVVQQPDNHHVNQSTSIPKTVLWNTK